MAEARLRASATEAEVKASAQSVTRGSDNVCEGDTHVHVQCKHGFVLISGERDDSLQPVCYRSKCKVEGERWLRSAGLTHNQMVGAINSACADLPPMPHRTDGH